MRGTELITMQKKELKNTEKHMTQKRVVQKQDSLIPKPFSFLSFLFVDVLPLCQGTPNFDIDFPPCWAGTLCWPKKGNFPDFPYNRIAANLTNQSGSFCRPFGVQVVQEIWLFLSKLDFIYLLHFNAVQQPYA